MDVYLFHIPFSAQFSLMTSAPIHALTHTDTYTYTHTLGHTHACTHTYANTHTELTHIVKGLITVLTDINAELMSGKSGVHIVLQGTRARNPRPILAIYE